MEPSETNKVVESAKADKKLSPHEQWELVKESFLKGGTFDGCTGVPDFDFGPDCCGEHDYHYQNLDLSRRDSDRLLRECMQAKGYIVLPWVYWLGVRILGRSHYRKRQNETINSNAADAGGP